MQLIFATANKNKLKEINLLIGNEVRFLGLADIGCTEDIPETADTLEGNALLKARYVADRYKVNCFSDDTGLEIDALQGQPGVLSARYAGEEKDPEQNINKVLHELHDVSNRKARFRTVIALIMDGEEFCFEGVVNGSILHARQGNSGFGYDPIFQPEGYTKSFAEMTMEEKNKISHRAIAVHKFVDYLGKRIRSSAS